ncbi:hypothetical protein [Nocardioides stalactiti]|uniref:hypothetical protein n=1 Tax=Nocardioides stalactiti TaxID=2755356 RepID=UPI001C8039A2|nr:hypothetical protein [Nocardioides stalactiti]
MSSPRGIEKGPARADDAAGDATTAIDPAGAQDATGAVEVFVSYLTWALASPAAAADPLRVSQNLGGHLNMGDATMLDMRSHDDSTDLNPSKGAYRVLGHSGDESAPDQVMLEFVAPLESDDRILWRKFGGVVAWVDGRWAPTSMQPRDVPQPADLTQTVAGMSDEERTRVLDGLGWTLFSNAQE